MDIPLGLRGRDMSDGQAQVNRASKCYGMRDEDRHNMASNTNHSYKHGDPVSQTSVIS